MLTKIMPKNAEKFVCEKCDFKCSKFSNYSAHVLTRKHKMLTNVDTENAENAEKFACSCGKEYNHRQSLSIHKKKCLQQKPEDVQLENHLLTPELVMNILQQNQEFKELIMEQSKTIIEISKNTTTTHNNINNSNNKTFNLQLYLNETCKNAMNIMDFVDSIKFQLSDLESIGELGYINGLSKVIIRNLKALDENLRPVHCSDLKREKIFVKDADKWEKEGPDNKILKNAIKFIAHKNVKMIPAFREKYPDCIYSDSRKSDQYNRLIVEAMGGEGNDENEKSNKIIKKIAREILICKEKLQTFSTF
jgi:hypothetical protein